MIRSFPKNRWNHTELVMKSKLNAADLRAKGIHQCKIFELSGKRGNIAITILTELTIITLPVYVHRKDYICASAVNPANHLGLDNDNNSMYVMPIHTSSRTRTWLANKFEIYIKLNWRLHTVYFILVIISTISALIIIWNAVLFERVIFLYMSNQNTFFNNEVEPGILIHHMDVPFEYHLLNRGVVIGNWWIYVPFEYHIMVS